MTRRPLFYVVPTAAVGYLVGGLVESPLPLDVRVWPAFEPRVTASRLKISPTADATLAGFEYLSSLDVNVWLAELAAVLESLMPTSERRVRSA
jgi:hypothetical protein